MGSPSGLWTAVSGSMAQSQNLDVIANNLANANTVGFKKDTPTFKEYLTTLEKPEILGQDIPRIPFRESDFYHFDGREHAFVNLNKIYTDHDQGNFKPTHELLDLAIDGPGFFVVKTPSGIMFTRNGEFKINKDGLITTNDGYPLLSLSTEASAALAVQQAGTQAAEGGRAPAAFNPFVELPTQPVGIQATQQMLIPVSLREQLESGGKIFISPEGKMLIEEEEIARLALAEFPDQNLLQKTSATLYKNQDTVNVPRMASQSKVRQGFLEISNVNPISELVELLKANRMYESNMRAIKAYNEMATKEANEVGKL